MTLCLYVDVDSEYTKPTMLDTDINGAGLVILPYCLPHEYILNGCDFSSFVSIEHADWYEPLSHMAAVS